MIKNNLAPFKKYLNCVIQSNEIHIQFLIFINIYLDLIMSDIMSDKQSFFLFGERVVFGKKTIDEQLLNPKILFLRGIIRKKPL